MAGAFELEVITPERVVARSEVEYVSVPAVDGQYGILVNHAPMVGLLKAGVVRYRTGGNTRAIAVTGGFFEVAANRMLVLGDEAELPEEIDVAAVTAEKERARKIIEAGGDQEEVTQARQVLERSLARLRAAGRG